MKTILTNGRIVLKEQILEGQELVLENGKISEIRPFRKDESREGTDVVYDAEENYIMPGMIDIHSDMIESYIQPRSTAVMEFDMGLLEAERVLAGCGITTMFHSISMYREGSWDVKEIRQAPQVRKLAELIGSYRHQRRMIRHRYHLRYEIDNLACYDKVMEMMEEGLVDLLSFMDHTPGQGQYKNLDIYRKHQPNAGKDLTEEEFEQLVDGEMKKKVITFEQLKKLTDCAKNKNISIASHDDDTIEKLEINEQLGVKISEFPITMEVAKKAVEKGFLTVLGAPNILLGGSHSGNLSALTAIQEGAASVLVSDYYPQAMLQSVFWLEREAGIPLWEAVKYVTLNPAKAVGMEKSLGSIEIGKKADLLVVDAKGKYPVPRQVYVNGECVMECQYRKAD